MMCVGWSIFSEFAKLPLLILIRRSSGKFQRLTSEVATPSTQQEKPCNSCLMYCKISKPKYTTRARPYQNKEKHRIYVYNLHFMRVYIYIYI